MRDIIKISDIILIIFFIIAGLLGTFFLVRAEKEEPATVQVTIDGKAYGSYPLSESRTVDLKSGNVITIEDGAVYMKSATCTGQDCVKEGKISRTGRTIVCLPHKVIIKIEGGKREYDTISK